MTPSHYRYGANATKDLKWVNRCINDFANVIGRCRSVERLELDTEHHCLLLVSLIPKQFFASVKSLCIFGGDALDQYQDLARVLVKCRPNLRSLTLGGFPFKWMPVVEKNCHSQVKEFHTALRDLTRLERFSLMANPAQPSLHDRGALTSISDTGTAHLGFTSLRSFELYASKAHASILLDLIQAPLEAVSLDLWTDPFSLKPPQDLDRILSNFLEQHVGHLRYVCVKVAEIPSGEAWNVVEEAFASANVSLTVTSARARDVSA